MKLDRLTSTTQSLPRETAERAREGAVGVRWRVDAAQGADGDRERSLQQELEAGKAKRSGSDDETQPLQEARAVAASLTPDPEWLGAATAAADIRAMQHERLYTRLYMS